MKLRVSLILFLSALVFLSSCTFQKRTYRKGYYVHWKSSRNKKEKISDHSENKIGIPENETVLEEPLFASNDETFILPVKKPMWDSIKTITCGDSLWSANGTVSLVKIIEITETVIKYKKCANFDGPIIVIPKNSVSKIKYTNGFVESYESEKKIEPARKENTQEILKSEKPSSKLSNLALIFAILALVLLFLFALFYFLAIFYLISSFSVSTAATGLALVIVAIICAFLALAFWVMSGIFSIVSLVKIQEDPKKYGGKGKAIAALSIFITIIILLALLLLALHLSS